jgi:hypothetical protein
MFGLNLAAIRREPTTGVPKKSNPPLWRATLQPPSNDLATDLNRRFVRWVSVNIGHGRVDLPSMSDPSKKSSPTPEDSENIWVRVQRLRQQVEDFQRTVEEELRTTRALVEELRVRRAKRRPRAK